MFNSVLSQQLAGSDRDFRFSANNLTVTGSMIMTWIMRLLAGGLFVFVITQPERVQAAVPEQLWLYTWIGIGMTVLSIWLLLEVTSRFLLRHSARRLKYVLVWSVAAFLMFDVLGTTLQWYSQHRLYDQSVHFISGIAVTAWFYSVLPYWLRKQTNSTPPVISSMLAVGCAIIVSVLFEGGEFAIDHVFGEDYWLGDAVDIISDVLAALLGSVAVIILMLVLRVIPPYTRQ